MQLNLEKAKENLKLNLEKKGIKTPPQAELAFILDVSGSFTPAHSSGVTQKLLERLVPWGMLFDPDQKLDVFTFSSGTSSAHHVGDIEPATCAEYIKRQIVNQVPGYGAGTDYAPVLEKALQNFGWLPNSAKRGFLGRWLGKKEQQEKRRSIVLFVTDGNNSDHGRTMEVLEASEQRKDEVYFLFIAVGNSTGEFPFLQKIADKFSNTGFALVKDLSKFVAATDDEVNDALIGDELIQWLKK